MIDVGFVSEFVERLLFSLVNSQLYGTDNARVREGVDQAARRLSEHCVAKSVPSVLLGAVAGLVILEGRPVLGASLSARRLLSRIQDRGAGGVEFLSTTTGADILSMLEVLSHRVPGGDYEVANSELAALGVSSLRFVAPYAGGAGGGLGEGIDVSHADVDLPIFALHQQTVDLLQSHALAVCQGRELDLGEVGATVDALVAGLSHDAAFLHSLAHYPEHDFFTFGHVIRVALLSLEVGRTLRHDPDTLRRLGAAALLHDVGKALVPWEVLHKRGPLDDEERREMQKHPVQGASILLQNREFDELAVAAAYGHHCTCDGKGYPWTCGEYEAKTVTKLVKICDCYEALTAVRPYKPAMSPAKAYQTMFSMKGHFDPTLLGHFIRTIGIYPLGTRVRLDDGSVARVARQSKDLRKPIVVLLEQDAELLGSEDRHELDLSAPLPGEPSTVTEALPQTTAVGALV